jgi:hypothetical protein
LPSGKRTPTNGKSSRCGVHFAICTALGRQANIQGKATRPVIDLSGASPAKRRRSQPTRSRSNGHARPFASRWRPHFHSDQSALIHAFSPNVRPIWRCQPVLPRLNLVLLLVLLVQGATKQIQGASKSGRGLPHSRTLPRPGGPVESRQVLDCASPLALSQGNRLTNLDLLVRWAQCAKSLGEFSPRLQVRLSCQFLAGNWQFG